MNKNKNSEFAKFSCVLGLLALVIPILATNRSENRIVLSLDSFVQQGVKQQIDTSCETGLLKFDESLLATKEIPDSYLIAVAHRGKAEKKKVTQYRFKGLENLSKIRNSKVNLLLTEGDSSDGLGRIDLFVGGKLYRQIYYEKNAKTFCDKP